ncbi:hypothetical protein RI030_16525 [Aphanizomenon flos-aquae NRERC-008]|jgi:hypothetical protein|uniref:Uncharacterized protein n=3 Tax=Aphanizomenonaceae TaxID=1892259 RepID=A0ACC7S641_DOLFA|nr:MULTISPECIES: hypothetical protein [Nostocales]MBO1044730.1 hypothetical protein [Aphanizomenon flos-aquae UKL13-PB]MBO1060865.1 hypothetical protein [Aphanizomenon flos-aquae CP01]OBQ24870.1 MAG: hypothetical protein AN481_13170 [Aphanizomenon flos-aquae LD13]HCQ21187.1 hypothetical protein [Anabaena sp. UBA12330]MBD2391250.1 hypothetical protein [Aphanizomenon flos-aquae FACHB-1171]
MVYSFTFPQEIIDSIQERIEVLERCLNDANPQDEAMAEMLELANIRQISFSEFKEEARQMLYLLQKFLKLDKKLKEQEKQGDLSILLFVRYNFLFKEIIDNYWNFFQTKKGRKLFKAIFMLWEKTYKEFPRIRQFNKNEIYIILETLKNILLSVIEISLKINVLTEEQVNFNIEDITPKESETTLTFLASIKKWDYVYRKLA